MTATLNNDTLTASGITREVETTYDPMSPDQIRQAAYVAGQAADARVNIELETEDGMTVNMGPQHPATHGTLRLIAKLDGEQVVSCEPVMGYMHRGYEKLTEVRTYPQVTTLVNRIDWLGSFANEVPFILAAEQIMGIEAPPRAQYIRTMLFEMARIANIVLGVGDMGVQMGAITPVFFAFRDREHVLNQIESATGGRFHPNYDRIGGIKEDLPKGWIAETKTVMGKMEAFCDTLEQLMMGNAVFQKRTRGIGIIPADKALDYGMSGANLRARNKREFEDECENEDEEDRIPAVSGQPPGRNSNIRNGDSYLDCGGRGARG